jgi:pyridoxine 5-phosphate synthase
VIDQLRTAGVLVSLFIEPDPAVVRAAKALGAEAVELHTGAWAEAWAACRGRHDDQALLRQRQRLTEAAHEAGAQGLRLHAGHGITYGNVGDLLDLPLLVEVNIGHSIISRAVLVGMERAVREMRERLAGR